jgi:hypothetical protein
MGTWQVATPCAGLPGVWTIIPSCTNGNNFSSIGETDFDCGGDYCKRCSSTKNERCERNVDCMTANCDMGLGSGEVASGEYLGNGDFGRGVCAALTPAVWTHGPENMLDYLDSDFYRQSFAHHLVHGNMNGSSYLNPYPIMEPGFCENVGKPRLPSGAYDSSVAANCSAIDYDSLLLGGCWCHPCLPNPCLHGGTCNNYNTQGYTCTCTGGREGDHCQTASGATDADFPWYVATGSPTGYMALFVPSPPSAPPEIYVPYALYISTSTTGGLFGILLLLVVWNRCKGKVLGEIEVDPDTNLPMKKYVARTGNPMIDMFAGGPAQPTPELMNTLALKADREDEEARLAAEAAIATQTGETPAEKEETDKKGKKGGKKSKKEELEDPQQAV